MAESIFTIDTTLALVRGIFYTRNSESETDSSACSARLTVISSTYASPLIPRICQLVIRALARVYHTFISLRGCSFRNARVSHSSLGADNVTSGVPRRVSRGECEASAKDT